jgi:hypothetical protein
MLIALLVFSFTLWFGLYLIAHDPGKPGLLFAGLGLVCYAVGVAFTLLVVYAPVLKPWQLLPLLLTAIFWMAASLYLVPEAVPLSLNTNRIVAIAIIGVLLMFGGMALNITQTMLSFIPLALTLYALFRVGQAFRSSLPRRPLIVLLTATLFFALSLGLLILPLEFLPYDILLLAISGDMVMLGFAIGKLDAYEEGTQLLPDALRSLAGVVLATVVFGGQVALLVSETYTLLHITLLLTVIASAIALETFSTPIQNVLDRLIFSPRIQEERSMLRAVNEALPSINNRFNPTEVDDAEFARLTRRAFSHFGDLNKLAANPLTQLPIVSERLKENGKADNLLERTTALKVLLTESVIQLKPSADQIFGTTDEWRYYNVLYFPYIAGLKPYSLRAPHDDLDPQTQAALDWFQTYVPERTLYNWQNAAARLIALYLRELSAR